MRFRTPLLVTFVVLLVQSTVPTAQNRSAERTQAASRSTESLSFSDVREVPADRTLLRDTSRETWYFVPSWADTGSGSGSVTGSPGGNGARRYRVQSPFAVFDKSSRRWRTARISRLAFEIYPVQPDPVDTSLIWFGVNDGPPGRIIEWITAWEPKGAVDDPLIFGGQPGGVGLIDTEKRTVTYFGKYRDLVGGRLADLLFERDAVWIYARDFATVELNGLSRFDRRTRGVDVFPVAWHGYSDKWVNVKFAPSAETLALTVLENREWFSRYEFDKVRGVWRQPRWGWVSAVDVPLFDRPDKSSAQIALLKPNMHFGLQGHGHFGHPIAILEERSGWQRVMTCQDVVGWTQSGLLINTLEMFRATLNSPAILRDVGNDGPRMFVWQARLYMTLEESTRQDQTLRNSDLAAAVSKGLLYGEDLRRASHLLTMNNSAQLESARYFAEAFAKRRQALLRRYPKP